MEAAPEAVTYGQQFFVATADAPASYGPRWCAWDR